MVLDCTRGRVRIYRELFLNNVRRKNYRRRCNQSQQYYGLLSQSLPYFLFLLELLVYIEFLLISSRFSARQLADTVPELRKPSATLALVIPCWN